MRAALGDRDQWHAVRAYLHELGGEFEAAAEEYAAAAERATVRTERDHLVRRAARARTRTSCLSRSTDHGRCLHQQTRSRKSEPTRCATFALGASVAAAVDGAFDGFVGAAEVVDDGFQLVVVEAVDELADLHL